jgi:DUF2934 family protein
MNKPDEQRNSKAPGHFENQGRRRQASGASAPGREERHQETREMAPTGEERRSGANAPDNPQPGQNERSSTDREDRIRQRAYRYWEEGGRQEGQAAEHWHRAAQDLDREDAELQRTGADGPIGAGRNRS